MSQLDELLAKWRSKRNAAHAIAVCAEIARLARADLAREVGTAAERLFSRDLDVMLALGRMYLACSMLPEAQAALVVAGKLDGEDERPFRLLAETLLRRGDAARAERVLARALALGADDAETRALLAKVPSLVALQKRSGAQAVASEVRRSLASHKDAPPARAPAVRVPQAPPYRSAPGSPSLPRFESEESIEISEVFERETSPGNAAARGRVAPRVPSSDDITQIRAERIPSYDEIEDEDLLVDPEPLPSAGFGRSSSPLAPQRRPAGAVGASGPARAMAPQTRVATAAVAEARPAFALPSQVIPPAPKLSPRIEPAREEPVFDAQRHAAPADTVAQQPAALVFEHLARVGIFEPAGGAPPAWEQAPRARSRGVVALLIGCFVLAGAGGGGYEYSRRLKVEREGQAAALTSEVQRLLRTGKVADLRSTDEKLALAFDLDSRSARAGRLWIENRVLGALLLAEEPRGIDSAVHRGRAVGLAEHELAAGRIAAFLVEADVAGAAAQLPKWDKLAGRDAIYQLAAGAVLERAGDARALERYVAAQTLDPSLVVADVLLARLLLVEYGVERARPVLDGLAAKRVDPLVSRALAALAWVVDPARSPELPETARLTDAERRRLPAPLAAIPATLETIEAMNASDQPRAVAALERAIALSHGPALPTTLGFLAIQNGNEVMARKAALRALSFAALYPRARTLAARVALLGGRVEEAQKAVEGLEPTSPDVAIVRSVVAYETGEVTDLEDALRALGTAVSTPSLAALAAAPRVLDGTALPDAKAIAALASPSLPWGTLVALDAALDSGNIGLVEELAARSGELDSAVELLRLARLRRYQGQREAALLASERAFAGKPTVALVVERTYELLESEQIAGAKDLVAKYPALLGQVGGWLGALIDAAGEQPAKAGLRLAKLDPPPDAAPTFLRVLAARALAAARDKRARVYVARLARRLPRHPDVILAAEALR